MCVRDMDVIRDPGGEESRNIHAMVEFENKRVLEIGAGDGQMTWYYAGAAASVLAIDVSASDVRKAKADTPQHLRPTVHFVEADATTYRYPRNEFDVAFLSYSLCCLPLDGVAHVLREVHRTLRRDGVMLDVHPVPRPSTVEVWRAKTARVLGSPDERAGIARIRAARRALTGIIREGLFAVGTRRWFDYRADYPSVELWLQQREERGATSVISEDLLASVRQEMLAPDATLVLRERVRATNLTPIRQ